MNLRKKDDMRISKSCSVVCAAALLAGSLAVRADDTPEQAAARAALLQKLSQPDAQVSEPTNPPPAGTIATPAAAPAPVQSPAPVSPATPEAPAPVAMPQPIAPPAP